jgi:hypothetical protein
MREVVRTKLSHPIKQRSTTMTITSRNHRVAAVASLDAVAVLIFYRTKIRTGHRQPTALAMCALALITATIAAWFAFPDAMTRYKPGVWL